MAGLLSLNKERVMLSKDTPAVQVPEGTETVLEEGLEVVILQELGGDFTVRGLGGRMFRIDGEYAKSLGREPPRQEGLQLLNEAGGEVTDEVIWGQLRMCYDPEIPVNIVELGLIYTMKLTPTESGGKRVDITMTLSAPGCGMGQVIADDVKRKVEKLASVEEAAVELVFDPPWSPALMSEAARLATGMM